MNSQYPELNDGELSMAKDAKINHLLSESIESIDAAVFTGDSFVQKANILHLMGSINRWGRELVTRLTDLADEQAYADGSFLKPVAVPVKDGVSLTLPFSSVELEPEEYGDYTVMVLNRDGTFVITDAAYCHPPGEPKEGYFIVRNGAYHHLLNVAYWADTKGIRLENKPLAPKPF